MKTALVTTCWLGTDEYIQKTIKWINYYAIHKSKIEGDIDIYILDNGSSVDKTKLLYKNISTLIHRIPFQEHLPRVGHLDYKYYWRAIWYYEKFFQSGYNKVVAIDNDFYAVSDKMFKFINEATGWSTPFCPRHNFPETACQIITPHLTAYSDFIKDKPFDFYNGKQCEAVLPLTHVERGLTGDRYSEYQALSQNDESMDFLAQTLPATQIIYGLR